MYANEKISLHIINVEYRIPNTEYNGNGIESFSHYIIIIIPNWHGNANELSYSRRFSYLQRIIACDCSYYSINTHLYFNVGPGLLGDTSLLPNGLSNRIQDKNPFKSNRNRIMSKSLLLNSGNWL